MQMTCTSNTKTKDNVFVQIVVAVQVQVDGVGGPNPQIVKDNVWKAHYKCDFLFVLFFSFF